MHSPSDAEGGNLGQSSPREPTARAKGPDAEWMEALRKKDLKIKELKAKIKLMEEKRNKEDLRFEEIEKDLK